MIENEQTGAGPSRIEVIDRMTLSDEPDGPALLISPRGAAWLVDGAVLLAAASTWLGGRPMLALAPERGESRRSPRAGRAQVAYFSLEFGLDPGLPLFVGGQGVLAGDYLKAAADLHLPSLGVGILWDEAGAPAGGGKRKPTSRKGLERIEIALEVEIAGEIIPLDAWCTRPTKQHTPLYLLEPTLPEHRALTRRLVGATEIERVAQEIILGVGGVRLLTALSLDVDVYHLAESQAVFAALELLREEHAAGLGFGAALAAVRRRVVLTTHTESDAGAEKHPVWLLRDLGATLGLPEAWLDALGGDPFSMTVAALRLAFRANAVSELHADGARRLWQHVTDRAPIVAITSGVHLGTWQDVRVRGAHGRSELAAVRLQLKKELCAALQTRAHVTLDAHGLIVGASGRASGEDRPDLIVSDGGAGLEALLDSRRLQLVFACKARPENDAERARVGRLVALSRRWPGRVVVLDDFDLTTSALLTRGCDVWLQTPRPPAQASGTSGMKAALNGALNLGVPGAGWSEGGRHGVTGWHLAASGNDDVDRATLFDLLENDVLPCWFEDRERWATMMEQSIETARRRFSAERMLESYYRLLYDPCLRRRGSEEEAPGSGEIVYDAT
jgi:starch phosphorylase